MGTEIGIYLLYIITYNKLFRRRKDLYVTRERSIIEILKEYL